MDMEGCGVYHLLLLYIIILTLKTQRGRDRLEVGGHVGVESTYVYNRRAKKRLTIIQRVSE